MQNSTTHFATLAHHTHKKQVTFLLKTWLAVLNKRRGFNSVTLYFDIVTLDVLLIISNFSTTCQLTLIKVLVYYIVDWLWLGVRLWLGEYIYL